MPNTRRRNYNTETEDEMTNEAVEEIENTEGKAKNTVACCKCKSCFPCGWTKWCFCLVLILLLIPCFYWEYRKLYNSVVGEKKAQLILGKQDDCNATEISWAQYFKSWGSYFFSWTPVRCQAYHKAAAMDPFWEVTPVKVFSSMLSSGIVQPVQNMFEGFGRALRLFFAEIPSQWQPIMFISCFIFIALILVLPLIVLLLVCAMLQGYSLHLPLLTIKPKKPSDE